MTAAGRVAFLQGEARPRRARRPSRARGRRLAAAIPAISPTRSGGPAIAWMPSVKLPFVLERGDATDLRIGGTLKLSSAGALSGGSSASTRSLSRGASPSTLTWRESRLSTEAPSRSWCTPEPGLVLRGVACEFVNAQPRVAELVQLYRGDAVPTPRVRRRREGLLGADRTVDHSPRDRGPAVLAFLGSMRPRPRGILRGPRTANWRGRAHHGPHRRRRRSDRGPHQLPRGLRHGVPGRRPAQAVRRQHLRRRPGRPLRHPRARPPDDGHHRLRPLRRLLRRRARDDEGLGGDRRPADHGLRPAPLPRPPPTARADAGHARSHALRRTWSGCSVASPWAS